jgi:hypothetical protein
VKREDLVGRISARLGGDPDGTSFSRGLVLGALIGAAIAGSTLWSRLRAARSEAAEQLAQEAVEDERVHGEAADPG